jgi:hypothetical protein
MRVHQNFSFSSTGSCLQIFNSTIGFIFIYTLHLVIPVSRPKSLVPDSGDATRLVGISIITIVFESSMGAEISSMVGTSPFLVRLRPYLKKCEHSLTTEK